MSEQTPRYLQKVVVPISNPATVPHMLQLASSLIDPDDDDSRVYALTVSIEGESTSERLSHIEPIVNAFISQGHRIELVTQIASSITRGILDGAREHGAEALILGVHKPDKGQVKLGSLVENIIEAAPCNVLVYRPAESVKFDCVAVPIDNNRSNQAALRTACLLAKSNEAIFSPLYIQRDYTYRKDKEQAIRATLDILDPHLIKKDIIHGRDPAAQILRQVDDNDLLVLGFSQKSNLDSQLEGDLTSKLLNDAPGPVLIASQIFQERGTVVGTLQRTLQHWNPAMTQVERNELVWQARKAARAGIDYSMLILLSAALASIGLMLNSVAVIIGAMLVAPLMSPLGALATGLATGQLDITRRAVVTLLQGVLLALIISFVMGSVLPLDTPTSEMLARGNPSMLDAAVALVSGLVAAFAIARKEIPVALAGVAIAAALMPPVCTIGLGLALGNPSLAGGATLLFLANILFIVVAQNVIFLWIGMRPGRRQVTRRGVTVWWTLILGLLVIVLSLIIALSQRAGIEQDVRDYLLTQLPLAQFVDIETDDLADNGLDVTLTVRAQEAISAQRVGELEDDISLAFRRPIDLEIVTLLAVSPRDNLEQVMLDYLRDTMQVARVDSLTITEGNATFFVEATVRSEQEITPQEIQQAEEALSIQLERPVRFFLVVQQFVTSDTPPEETEEADSNPAPESTDEADSE
ncbi:MAG: DUF389 domain-containing protein [Anaerolineae bacterium]|nr:DUF389 domain-containing protein [Anaerolineae bacterium]MDQ7035651.1 DUF389 domain-containing protein [Anaerolineae bacterium]